MKHLNEKRVFLSNHTGAMIPVKQHGTKTNSLKLSTNSQIFQTENPNCYMVVNTFNKDACLISKDMAVLLQKNEFKIISEIQPKLLQTLSEMEIILKINDNSKIEEFERLKENQKTVKSHNITFALTLACNLNCPYCLQSGGYKHDNFDVFGDENSFKKIIDFLDKYIITTSNEIPINLNWYGGEPLIKSNYIEYIFEKIERKYIDRKISSTIISNGTLLDDEKLRILIKAKTKTAQITVDGIEDIHNSTRAYKKTNKPTYDVILMNIKKLSEHMKVIVRYNWSQDHGVEPIYAFYQNMNAYFGNNDKIEFHTIPLVSNAKTCGSFLNIAKDNKEREILEQYLKADIESRQEFGLPGRGIGYDVFNCNANKDGNIVISPNGDLYLCVGSVGKKEAIVGNAITGYNGREKIFRDSLPIDEECIECAFLLSCGGGCRYNAHTDNGDIHSKHCTKEKNEILLRESYQRLFKSQIDNF